MHAQYQPTPKDVNVAIEFDESGFAKVTVKDSYVSDASTHVVQFLAAGNDDASDFMDRVRDSASST